MVTLWVPTTWQNHTESFSGILTSQYLPHPYLLRGGGGSGQKRVSKERCRQGEQFVQVVESWKLNEAEKRQAKRLICSQLLVFGTFHYSALKLSSHEGLSAYHSAPVIYSVWKKLLGAVVLCWGDDWTGIAGKLFSTNKICFIYLDFFV